MKTRSKTSTPNRLSNIMTMLALLAALAPAATLKAQQQQDQPDAGAGGRRGRAGSAATRPAAAAAGRVGSGGVRIPVLGEGPTCTFDATVYDVRLPANQIGRLDVAALAGAADTAEAFEKALEGLGAARPIYRADQSIRISGDTISIGSQAPYVSASSVTSQGQTIKTVSYLHTGAIFSFAGKADNAGFELDLKIEVSSVHDSALQNGEAKQPIIHSTTLSHKGPVQARMPFIVVSVDAGSLDKDGKAIAYIGRVTVGEPQGQSAR